MMCNICIVNGEIESTYVKKVLNDSSLEVFLWHNGDTIGEVIGMCMMK